MGSRNYLKNYLRSTNKLFPRDIMHLKQNEAIRIKTKGLDELIDFSNIFVKDCYVSVFSDWQIANKVFDTIFLDIDGETSEESFEKYEKIKQKISGYSSRCYFSGRGFHVFLDMEPLVFKDFCGTVRQWVFNQGLDRLVDKKVIDVRRVSRLPFNINSKTGMFCIPVSKDDVLKEIIRRAKIGQGGEGKELKLADNDSLRRQLEFIDRNRKSFTGSSGSSKVDVEGYFKGNMEISKMPPCIQNMIKIAVRTGELDHEERLTLGIFLTKLWGIEKIKKFFKNIFRDYNESITSYQLLYLKRKNYNVFKCERIRQMTEKYCQFNKAEECCFAPSINYFFKRGGKHL